MVARSSIHLLVVCAIFASGDTSEAACLVQVQGDPTQHASLIAALSAAHAVSHRNHTVNVSGVCTENVTIRDFENLRIQGAPGTEIRPAVATLPVINITLSKNVELRNLTIKGSSTSGVLVANSVAVVLQTSTIEENRLNGLVVRALSSVELRDSQVRANTGQGILNTGGHVALTLSSGVHDNGGVGIVVGPGGSSEVNCAAEAPCRITGNDRGGVRSPGGAVQLTNVVVQGNGRLSVDNDPKDEIIFPGAISSSSSGTLSMVSVTVSDNFGDGVTAFENASAAISRSTIEHNGGDGVLVDRSSTLNLTTGDSILRNNGSEDLRCRNGSFTAVLEGTIIGSEKCSRLLKQRLEDLPPSPQ